DEYAIAGDRRLRPRLVGRDLVLANWLARRLAVSLGDAIAIALEAGEQIAGAGDRRVGGLSPVGGPQGLPRPGVHRVVLPGVAAREPAHRVARDNQRCVAKWQLGVLPNLLRGPLAGAPGQRQCEERAGGPRAQRLAASHL